MVREIITLGCGGAGIHIVDSMWRQYCQEYEVLADGTMMDNAFVRSDRISNCFFHEKKMNRSDGNANDRSMVPRNLFLDSTTGNINIDGITSGDMSGLYDKDHLLDFNCGSAINYARAYYNYGTAIKEEAEEHIRKLLNQCDHFGGFLVMNSVVGGIGAGLTPIILDGIIDYYGNKTNLFGVQLYPSRLSKSSLLPPVISTYNTALSTNKLINYNNMVSIVLDNKALYKQRKKHGPSNLGNASTYGEINQVAAKTLSSLTWSIRFSGNHLPCDLEEYRSNLVSIPRLHFMVTSMVTMASKQTTRRKKVNKVKAKKIKKKRKLELITEKNLQTKNFAVQMKNVNKTDKHFTSLSFHYSSQCEIPRSDYYYHLQWLQQQKLRFLSHRANKNGAFGLKCGFIIKKLMSKVDNGGFDVNVNGNGYTDQIQSTMIGNSMNIGKCFGDRVLNQFDSIYSKKRFVHWYLQEGLEECEFDIARENVKCLVSEYNSIRGDFVNDTGNNNVTKINDTNRGDCQFGDGIDDIINREATPVHLKSNTMGIRWIPPSHSPNL